MKTSDKIKGILASTGLTYEEFAKLCGLTRQTIHMYLNTGVDIEDYERGLVALDVSGKLLHLAVNGVLPLAKGVPKESRVERIRELLKN